ncbi:hypothetical protein [Haliea sp. E17]|uniref:hypothetical protein n=1 Tax=Haliea sp. E17 TaxID=3401576 RepID=UPI003AABF879
MSSEQQLQPSTPGELPAETTTQSFGQFNAAASGIEEISEDAYKQNDVYRAWERQSALRR